VAKREAAKTYLKNQLESLTSFERLLIVYDVAVKACQKQDKPKALEALRLLKHSLNSAPSPQLAVNLDKVYSDCIDSILHHDDWQQALNQLEPLRQSWMAHLV